MSTGLGQSTRQAPTEGASRWIGSDVAAGLLVCLPLAVLYCVGVQSTVGRGDSAEFVTAAYTLSLAHPPGYPIYTLLGRLCCLLPAGTIPLRVNLLSSACAFLALVLVFLIAVKEARCTSPNKTLSWTAGIIAVMLVGLSPSFWRYAVVAEAYAINALAVTAFAFLMLGWLRTGRPNLLWGGSLSLGIALGTHLSTIFLVPTLVGAVLLKGRSLRSLLQSVGLLALGASQYVFVIVRAARASVALFPESGPLSPLSATKTDNALVNGLWYMTGGPWRDSHPRSFERVVSKFEEITRWVRVEYPLSILVFALAGGVLVFLLGDRRLRPHSDPGRGSEPDGDGLPDGDERAGARWRWGLLACIALSEGVFYLSYGPSQIGMVLPLVICVGIFAAVGLIVITGLLARALRPKFRLAGWRVMALAALVAVAAWSTSRAFSIRPPEDGAAVLVAQAIDRLPAGSYLAGLDYRYIMIINYYRLVEKRDVKFTWGGIDDSMLTDDRIAQGAGFVLGTPRNLLRMGRAGIDLEAYLTVENAPTVYVVRMSEGEFGADGQSRLKLREASERFRLGGRRSRTKKPGDGGAVGD